MRMWVYNPHIGGKTIPLAVKARTVQRILDHAAKHHPGKFTRIELRFRGALCYIDAAVSPRGSPPAGETRAHWIERLRRTPLHLCRIRYFGDENRWSFAWYNYAREKYEPAVLSTGDDHATPEEAFDESAQSW